MDLFNAILFTGIGFYSAYVYNEYLKQQYDQRERQKKLMQDEINMRFEEISSGIYTQKSEDEFRVGMALISLLDLIDNPQEYNVEAEAFVNNFADEAAALFKMKYNAEILAVNEEETWRGLSED